MKKINFYWAFVALVFLLCASSMESRAQGFRYGPRVGISMNTSYVNGDHPTRGKLGFNIGGVVRYEFKEKNNNTFFLESGLHFQSTGQDMGSYTITAPIPPGAGGRFAERGFVYRTYDLMLPLQVGLKMDLGKRAFSLRAGLFLRQGLYAGIKVKGQDRSSSKLIEYSYNGYRVAHNIQNVKLDKEGAIYEFNVAGLAPLSLGLCLGADMEVTKNWLIGVNSQMEFSEFYSTPFVSGKVNPAFSRSAKVFHGITSIDFTYLF